jgi:transcriptional regulator with XRE-family HTH domain
VLIQLLSLVHFAEVTKVRDKKLLENFGTHLRELRLKRGLSQEYLANDADIPINQVGRIERGEINPSLSTINSIAKALNIKLYDLMKF